MRSNYTRLLEARELFGDLDRWGDYDWIFGAAKCNLKIVELPVHYVERVAGETQDGASACATAWSCSACAGWRCAG